MKISNDTLAILKNFASINSNVLIKPGNMVKTISPVKNVLVESHVTEDFPVEFGVWDLNKFLATVNLFTDPIFNFEDKYVTISESGKTNSLSRQAMVKADFVCLIRKILRQTITA